MTTKTLISIQNMSKRYGGVVAVDDVSLHVEAGTIHALVGENGAGKSTLVKVLAGAVQPDSGTIAVDGQIANIQSPQDARELGIGMFYQELSIFGHRSALANLFPYKQPTSYGFISFDEMKQKSSEILNQLGLHVDLRTPAGTLSIGEQQLLELCRVMLTQPRLIILDEPNSALNEQETARLFAVLAQLKAAGVTMLYVSHRLEEVFEISDYITVMRNGQKVSTQKTSETTIPSVIEDMIGGRQQELYPPPVPLVDHVEHQRIEVNNLSSGVLHNISFSAKSGEIVGFAGLDGSGVSDVLAALFGLRKVSGGEVVYPDGKGLPGSPVEAARRRICFVPSDRKRSGLMLEKTILSNIVHVTVGSLEQRFPWLRQQDMVRRSQRQIEALNIKTSSPFSLASQLSGGNQQKVVIGKWLEVEPNLILLDDPTRGVDVGAKREIYLLIRQMGSEGKIVLFSSTELSELVGLCDRIIVIYRGHVAGELAGDTIDEQNVLHMVNTGEKS
jgi:ABC-type sugar transport system ATPase subunit